MKVFNITDASTAALRNRGLENQHIKVGEVVIPPGGSAVLRGTAKERSELQVYLKVGAASLDELPVVYASKRGLTIQGEKIAPEPVLDVALEPEPESVFDIAEEVPEE
jgi:hypothetical protein